MAGVAALRLRLRVPEGQAARIQARTEEALRLAAPDDSRLLILRRLDLGRLPVNAHASDWAGRAGARMAALASRAVHAAAPGASAAEAVWFRSEAEGLLLLLAELAAGRTAFAWFWKLALPDWHAAPLSGYLHSLIAAAGQDPQRLIELARAVTRIAEIGNLPKLLAALPNDLAQSYITRPPMTSATAEPPSADLLHKAAEALASALHLFERLPALVRHASIRAWHDMPADSPAAAFLARMLLLSVAPELATQPPLLVAKAQMLTQRMSSPYAVEKVSPLEPQAVMPGRKADPRVLVGEPRPEPETPDLPASTTPAAELDQAAPEAALPPTGIEEAPSPQINDESPPFHAERASSAAGLWLLIQPLSRMGIEQWLDARPEFSAAGFARALLRHIAERMRVPAGDPLFGLIGETELEHDPALLAAWRIGLDRWLRRRIRRKLSDVVMRGGWLSQEETGIGIRFRVDQADIALRVRALDVDPGWVPWLGLSIAYHYRDEAWR